MTIFFDSLILVKSLTLRKNSNHPISSHLNYLSKFFFLKRNTKIASSKKTLSKFLPLKRHHQNYSLKKKAICLITFSFSKKHSQIIVFNVFHQYYFIFLISHYLQAKNTCTSFSPYNLLHMELFSEAVCVWLTFIITIHVINKVFIFSLTRSNHVT